MKFRKNDGFTLVELMVTIVIASIVTAAASTVLLLGIRLNNKSTTTAQQQNTARIFLSVMENMASSGEITEVVSKPDYWYIVGKSDTPETPGKILFYYKADDAGTGTIYSGGISAAEQDGFSLEESLLGGVPMMEGVIAAHIVKDKPLLHITVQTADGSYTSSVYCRTLSEIAFGSNEVNWGQMADDTIDTSGEVNGVEARKEFLSLLLSQLGSNGMYIKDGVRTPLFFSRWYSEGWPPETPWCACFISWALNQQDANVLSKERVRTRNDEPNGERIWYADVDDFVKFFVLEAAFNAESEGDEGDTNYEWHSLKGTTLKAYSDKPDPGDILFMDWSLKQNDAAHVGVVLAVTETHVYTIEGNSANTVAVRKYSLESPVLMGYGVIDWKPDPKPAN